MKVLFSSESLACFRDLMGDTFERIPLDYWCVCCYLENS